MRRSLPSTLVFLATMAAVILAGCGGSDEPTVPKDDPLAAIPKGAFSVGFCLADTKGPWQKQMKADALAAATKQTNLHVLYFDAAGSVKTQQSQIEKLAAGGVKLIVVNPVDTDELTPLAMKVLDSGISLIVLQRPLVCDYLCEIRTNDEQLGTAAGRWLAEKLEGRGNVVELRSLETSEPPRDRSSGFQKVITDNVDMRLLGSIPIQLTQSGAKKQMKEVLDQYEQIDAVYAHSDEAAHGAYLAAQEAGREKEILFLGIGGLPGQGQAYVKAGTITTSFQYATGGAEAIHAALKIRDKGQPVKKIVPTIRFFTAENIGQGGELVE